MKPIEELGFEKVKEFMESNEGKDLKIRNKNIRTVVAASKTGNIMIFNVRNGKPIFENFYKNIEVPDDYLIERKIAKSIIDSDSGEVLAEANAEITEELLEKIKDLGINLVNSLDSFPNKYGIYEQDKKNCLSLINEYIKINNFKSSIKDISLISKIIDENNSYFSSKFHKCTSLLQCKPLLAMLQNTF